jgi:hypothetical protein
MLGVEVDNGMKRKAMKFAAAAALAFLAGFLSTVRSAPAQDPVRFDLKVRNDFFAGFAGDAGALARGMKACENVLAANPKAPEPLVWHGSGLLFEAQQAFAAGNQQKGVGIWTRGLGEMQTAVDLAPDNVGVRIPRGAVLLTSTRFIPNPEIANPLLETGLSDFEHVYQIQKPKLSQLGTHPLGELLFGLAEGYSRAGNEAKAREYFEMIAKELPNTGYAKRAATWMETKSLPASQTGCIGCHVSK